jgi:alanine or glycine:cation symporter, AGCS family
MDFSIATLLGWCSSTFTSWVVLPSLILLGFYLSLRLRCVQVLILKMGFVQLFDSAGNPSDRGEGNMSRYQAVATVIASGFGTGNISGMAVALATGGPGALFWMWVMAFLGSVVQFANTILGIKYRIKNEHGEYTGGPMYYLQKGLNWKAMAVLFSIFVILVAYTAGDFVQVNSIALPLSNIGIEPWMTGLIMMVVVGAALLGGVSRIAVVASFLIPFMALFYISFSVGVLVLCRDQLYDVLSLIGRCAFGFGPAVGGVLGYGVMQAAIFGFNRAIFATDAGTGLAPILQSGACSKHPVIDGIATLVAPFMVMLVCTVTFLVLMVTGAYLVPDLQSTNMVLFGFSKVLGNWGAGVVFIALFLFAYTTIIATGACADRAVEYLFGIKWVKLFRWSYILLVPVGAILKVSMAWVLADISMTVMLVINVFGTAMLTKEVISEYNNYFAVKEEPSITLSDEPLAVAE